MVFTTLLQVGNVRWRGLRKQHRAHLSCKLHLRKFRRVRLQCLRLEHVLNLLPTLYGIPQGLVGGLAEKDSAPRLGGGYGLKSSSSTQSDHRLSASQSLHRGDPKILLRRHEKRTAAGVQIAQLWIARLSAKLDVPV